MSFILTMRVLFLFLQGVKDVVATWDNMKFNIIPYFKGTQERGFILGSVEEILLTVDNDAMNLQSMAGSRFVGPFLGTIQQLEKDLSLISETIEVRKGGCNSHVSNIISKNLTEFFFSGVAACTAEMDIPGKHFHWW